MPLYHVKLPPPPHYIPYILSGNIYTNRESCFSVYVHGLDEMIHRKGVHEIKGRKIDAENIFNSILLFIINVN